MSDRPVILLIEDDNDSAEEYIEDAQQFIDAKIILEIPPRELMALAELVKKHYASAVVLDERLQQRSDASYLGIDAMNYLADVFPGLPIFILTEYSRDPELKKVTHGQLFQKVDLLEENGKKYHFDELAKLIKGYQKKKSNIDKQRTDLVKIKIDEVSEESVKKIAYLHFSLDDEVDQIIWFENKEQKEICLIEVNRTALPTDKVEPFLISASEEIPIPLLIADVTSKEWEKIEKEEIQLPVGWNLRHIKVFKRDETLGEE